MDDSILTSVKQDLGIVEEYTVFDQSLIRIINTCFSILHQLGVGPDEGFSISDETSTWGDYLEDYSNLEPVKAYISQKTKMLWDTPSNGTLNSSLKETLGELEFRLIVEVDHL